MNKNITELFGIVLSNEELMKEFARINEVDELYKFCLSIKDGYTKDEFNDFIIELLEFFDDSEGELKELDESDSELVAGGTSKIKKWLAGGLAAASMFSTGIETFAKGTAENNGTSSVTQLSDESKKEVSVSSATKIKEKFKQVWRDHKGKIILGGGVLTLAALAAIISPMAVRKYRDEKDKREKEKKEQDAKRKETVEQLEVFKTKDKEYIGKLAAGESNEEERKKYEERQAVERHLELSLKQESKDDEKSKRSLNFGSILATVLGGSAAVKGVVSVWDMLGSGITKFSTRAKEIKSITSLGRSLADLIATLRYNYKVAMLKINGKGLSLEDRKKLFEDELLEIKGQDEALNKIRTFFYGILMERDVAKASGKQGTANVIVLNGPAGVGKTLTANALARALCKGDYYSMNGPNELDGTGDIKKDLLGDGSGGGLWGGFDFDSPKQGIATYLQNNPEGVVIINEYDKIKKKRPTDTHPLDELLRGMLDEGFIVSGGKKIDCSKVTFIFTTNETDASLQGRVKVKDGKLVDPDLEHDTTGSRTVVLHDKSFLTRFKTVSFKNLNDEAYYEIAKKEFTPLVRFMASDLGGNVDLNISEETYRKIAEFTLGMQEGARPIRELNRNLGSKISMLIGSVKAKDPKASLKGLKLNTSFNFEGRDGNFDVSIG